MKKILSTPLGKHSLHYRQAVTGAPHRGWSLRNICLYPIMKMTYPFKKNESFIVDTLIVGANPLLNLLLLSQIANKAAGEQKHINVGILKLYDAEHWAYHQLLKPSFWKEIRKDNSYFAACSDFHEFIEHIIQNTKWDYVETTLIEDNNYQIQYFKKDEISDLTCFHLINNQSKNTEGLFTDKMPLTQQKEQQIKQNISDNVYQQLNNLEHIKILSWANGLQASKGNEEKSHILMCNDVFLTSLPRNWLDIKSTNQDNYSYFEHAFSDSSFGSAKKIANDFLLLEKQSKTDLLDILEKAA